MDVSAKIPEEDMILIGSLQTQLARRGIRVSKIDVVDAALKLADPEKIQQYVSKKKKDNTKELIERFLNYPIQPFEGDLIEEHDTTF